MSWGDYLTYLGIKLPDAVAGMCGGLVKALLFHKDEPVEAVIATIIGALTANYLGEGVSSQLTSLGVGRGASCFITGIIAMILVQLAIDQAKKWTPKNNSANGGGGPTNG